VRQDGSDCRHIEILLSVYVLGGLRGYQVDRVRAHLARCRRCQGEYEELAQVPALLALITGEQAAAATLADQTGTLDERSRAPAKQERGPDDGTE
jgi:predicted anti-sigma-YlaC factor YlaD